MTVKTWHDTVMKLNELALLKQKYVKETGEIRLDIRDYVFATIREQAEISFSVGEKQGINKMVEWITPYLQNMGGRDSEPFMWIMISEREWLTKLKEFGIEK